MTRLGDAPILCEECGEQEQEIRLDYAGLCGDCFGRGVSEALVDYLGYKPCGRPLWHDGELRAICIEKHGDEHEHSGLRY
jgi:hypothetical protein